MRGKASGGGKAGGWAYCFNWTAEYTDDNCRRRISEEGNRVWRSGGGGSRGRVDGRRRIVSAVWESGGRRRGGYRSGRGRVRRGKRGRRRRRRRSKRSRRRRRAPRRTAPRRARPLGRALIGRGGRRACCAEGTAPNWYHRPKFSQSQSVWAAHD